MPIDEFEKQPYESFLVAGDYRKVLDEGESLILSQSLITASDRSGVDASSVVLELSTKTVIGSQLKVRCRSGDLSKSPYLITFRVITDMANKWEVDGRMVITDDKEFLL